MANNSHIRLVGTGVFLCAIAAGVAGMQSGLHAATLPTPAPPAFSMSLQAFALADGLHMNAMLANVTRAGAALHFHGRNRVVFWATTETGCVIWRGASARASDALNAMMLSDSETKTFSGHWPNFVSMAGDRRVVMHARLLSSPAINATDLAIADRGQRTQILPVPTAMLPVPAAEAACSAASPTPRPTTDPHNIEGATDDVTPAPAVEPEPTESPVSEPDPTESPISEPDPTDSPMSEPDPTDSPMSEPDPTNSPVAQSNAKSVSGVRDMHASPAIAPAPGKRHAAP